MIGLHGCDRFFSFNQLSLLVREDEEQVQSILCLKASPSWQVYLSSCQRDRVAIVCLKRLTLFVCSKISPSGATATSQAWIARSPVGLWAGSAPVIRMQPILLFSSSTYALSTSWRSPREFRHGYDQTLLFIGERESVKG